MINGIDKHLCAGALSRQSGCHRQNLVLWIHRRVACREKLQERERIARQAVSDAISRDRKQVHADFQERQLLNWIRSTWEGPTEVRPQYPQ